MAGNKRYGADGPPQLIQRTRPLSAEELQLLSIKRVEATDWFRRVLCACGREDDFRILTTDPAKPLISIDGIELGVVHLELACESCNAEIPVFDNRQNGWNAVICGERASLPTDYARRVRDSLESMTCNCGSTAFGCVVWYAYDSHPDDLPEASDDWDEAFGCFAAWFICSRCGNTQLVAEAETA
jgi:hypothetical protein